jgi:hypothetical protein
MVQSSWSAVQKEALLIIRKSISNKKATEAIDEINATVAQWKTYADEAGLYRSSVQRLAKRSNYRTIV